MKFGPQTTLCDRVTIEGRGVHSNASVSIILHPAEAGSGIVFLRTGLPAGRERLIEARWSNVTHTELCTVLGDQERASVSTIEHLMAALAGLGVDNALIEIDGPEAPIMDGSAAPFVAAIDKVGLIAQSRRRRHLRILKTVRVDRAGAWSELRPYESGFRLDIDIDFDAAAIGRQRKTFDLDAATFRSQIAPARTFGFVSDVKRLWQLGFALGSSLENSVALDDGVVVNPEGLRFSDEFVRHKALDAIGDLALAGAPILGCYRSHRPGHAMNALALDALFADRRAFEFVDSAPRREFAAERVSGRRIAAAAY